MWKLVLKNGETILDPHPIVEELVRIDTGNPYIVSLFTTGDVEHTMYNYNAALARSEYVFKKLESIGCKQVAHEHEYKGQAHTGKVYYHNSSSIRFLQAFNQYIFSDYETFFGAKNTYRGTLKSMIDQYDADIKQIDDIINIAYQKNIVRPSLATAQVGAVLDQLATIQRHVLAIDPKASSNTSYRLS